MDGSRWNAGFGRSAGADATSAARAINDIGQVVGVAQTTTGGRAFLWTATDGIQDLNALIDPLDPLKAAYLSAKRPRHQQRRSDCGCWLH